MLCRSYCILHRIKYYWQGLCDTGGAPFKITKKMIKKKIKICDKFCITGDLGPGSQRVLHLAKFLAQIQDFGLS